MKRQLFTVSAILIFTFGCIDESEIQRGNIIGKIGYYEKEFVNYIDSLSDVNIKLTNSDGVFETTSGTDGTFVFENIPAGNYVLSVGKDSYIFYDENSGEFIREPFELQVTHVGAGITDVQTLSLYEVPDYSPEFNGFEWISDTVLVIHLTIPPSVQDYYPFNIYISEDATVSPTDFDFVWQSGRSFNYFEEPMTVDTLTGKVSLKLPFLRAGVNHYFAVTGSSIWAYELEGPISNAVLITP
jgi:hypothetical protein